MTPPDEHDATDGPPAGGEDPPAPTEPAPTEPLATAGTARPRLRRRRREEDAPQSVEETLAAADKWFDGHGLPYFVPERRAQVREGLSPRRTLPRLGVAVGVSAALGVLLAVLTDQVSAAPALVVASVVAGGLWYALTTLQAGPVVRWAGTRTLGNVRHLLPQLTRALPLLLVFVTFLFINAEVWQLSASLAGGALWLTLVLFVALAIGFLVVRLPEEVDRLDDAVDEDFLRRACEGTPLAGACRDLLARRREGSEGTAADPVARAQVSGYERTNLVLFLVILQAGQLLLLSALVTVFFLLFGVITMDPTVQETWTASDVAALPLLSNLSVALVKVSLFLGSFSFLYLAVSTVTDESYRSQLLGLVVRELERAVGLRAVYLALRGRGEEPPPTTD
ncbi:hypothetical protein [Nocardioides bruguierae]|uniref:hypothetical protein n=1 Tax=Nocardioides bruguierae TaxID=2945102 RepID=UPI00201FCEB2|nr:hypothetical protein [Nocardioides bruguierae]MCL8027096.1 hypothetical protein [Nocardioides bruguierae]